MYINPLENLKLYIWLYGNLEQSCHSSLRGFLSCYDLFLTDVGIWSNLQYFVPGAFTNLQQCEITMVSWIIEYLCDVFIQIHSSYWHKDVRRLHYETFNENCTEIFETESKTDNDYKKCYYWIEPNHCHCTDTYFLHEWSLYT